VNDKWHGDSVTSPHDRGIGSKQGNSPKKQIDAVTPGDTGEAQNSVNLKSAYIEPLHLVSLTDAFFLLGAALLLNGIFAREPFTDHCTLLARSP